MIVVGFEAVAGAKVLMYWIHAPLWLLSLCLMIMMTATNLFSVSSFGEFEFWFAGIKVAVIVVFLALGAAFAFGLLPGHHMDFGNLTSHGGLFPKGVEPVFATVVIAIFSMTGTEIITIAAAETPDPEYAVQRAMSTVMARIAVFFVGSVFLLVVILPWDTIDPGTSPYVAAFQRMGIPGADQIMNAVVVTAVLSCLNSGLYTASRMMFVLAGRREAPASLVKVSRRGCPTWPSWPRRRWAFVRDHGLDRAHHGIHLPAQFLWCGSAFRLPADRFLPDRLARPNPTGEAAGADVVFPLAADSHGGRHLRCAGPHGFRRRRAQPVLAQHVVLGCRARDLRDNQADQPQQPDAAPGPNQRRVTTPNPNSLHSIAVRPT
ncbi:amino acid permease family protein [Mycobacterium ulcerans str. Harvey]|uniref:Amino acid permease family protein n=1 Tax=Mycobacterium ulcerans str. Harvey TaxID=1299332 RepID=A0ABN0R637_MYCUL|nr:amino acid permease family protein [Mycobacterium ulcerans str. Harvey]